MPSTGLSKIEFEREIAALLRLREQVATLRPAVETILKFASAYRTLHQRIGANETRRAALRRRLGLDQHQHQRLMTIGLKSKTLGQFRRALPAAIEPLYELARLTKDTAGENRLREAVERHELTPTSGIRDIRAIRQSSHDGALPETKIAAMRAEVDKLNAHYMARVEQRAEQAVGRLIDRKWKKLFWKVLRSTKGMPFGSQKARWHYAERHVGIKRDEVTGGTFDAGAAWVNSEPQLAMLMKKAEREGGVNVTQSGEPIVSMLLHAFELGSDSGELFNVIKAARDGVRVPKRLVHLTKMLEAADAVENKARAAEIDGDNAKLRDLMSRLPSNRARRSLANWGKNVEPAPAAPNRAVDDDPQPK